MGSGVTDQNSGFDKISEEDEIIVKLNVGTDFFLTYFDFLLFHIIIHLVYVLYILYYNMYVYSVLSNK